MWNRDTWNAAAQPPMRGGIPLEADELEVQNYLYLHDPLNEQQYIVLQILHGILIKDDRFQFNRLLYKEFLNYFVNRN